MAIDKSKSLIMAQRLRELRIEKGLSYEALRKALMEKYEIDISIDSLKNYEVSKVPHAKAYKNEGMRVEYLRCLADFYGVSSDWLIGSSSIKSIDPNIHHVIEFTGLSEDNVLALNLYSHPQKMSSLLDSDKNMPIVQTILENARQKQSVALFSSQTMTVINRILFAIVSRPRGISSHFSRYISLMQKKIEYEITAPASDYLIIDSDLVDQVNEWGFDVMSFSVGAQWHLRMVMERLEKYLDKDIEAEIRHQHVED